MPIAASAVQIPDGTVLYCRAWGRGRPVVFVHGWAVSSDIWQYQMLALAREARCIAYDKRGHGRSSDPGQGYDYDTFADDLAAVLDHYDLHDAVLVGHSMGPGEIVRYLARHGTRRVSRLVLISPALPFMLKTADNPDGIDAAAFEQRRRLWAEDMPKFLADNAEMFVTADTSPETIAWIAGLGLQASLYGLLETNRAIAETDLREDVARVDLPTMIIHGDQDRSAPPDSTGRQTALMIDDSTFLLYRDAPHGLIVTHQEQLNAELASWIRA
jgi:non-heme chloroperoxidase